MKTKSHKEAFNIAFNKNDKETTFLFEISGLIYGEFIRFQTDSKKVVMEILKLMDNGEK